MNKFLSIPDIEKETAEIISSLEKRNNLLIQINKQYRYLINKDQFFSSSQFYETEVMEYTIDNTSLNGYLSTHQSSLVPYYRGSGGIVLDLYNVGEDFVYSLN